MTTSRGFEQESAPEVYKGALSPTSHLNLSRPGPIEANSPSTTALNMSSNNNIPQAIMPTAPMFQTLPTELLLEIFKHYIMMTPLKKPGTVVDQKRFAIINRTGYMSRICCLSGAMTFLSMEAYYSLNEFCFKAVDVVNFLTPYMTSLPPPLPPLRFRKFLRRIQVHIALEDFYNITDSAEYSLPAHQRRSTRHAVTTTKELFDYCPGARTLATLTDMSTGFYTLQQLELHIHTWFLHDEQTALAIVKEAGFALRARKVTVLAWREISVALEMAIVKPFPEIVDLISVNSAE
ncbi:hypothetical protein EK21DRAFT_111770 [Setomelanomma holmii]|uniref:Uncharacterized protein n=1 Tax=Setomelanomma holmii TaxID=210430 RepID=A0A9P4HBS1_9PLEO|nr:hypothetical protein EK21DRAFT_111770 [Setomelanomma holmii]